MFLLWTTQLSWCGDWTPASVPLLAKGRFSPTNTPVPHPHPDSFVLQSFAWLYIFFSSAYVLLSTLSWCSASTSVSEGVFLMHPQREMYSMSTYSSVTFFLLPTCICIFNVFMGGSEFHILVPHHLNLTANKVYLKKVILAVFWIFAQKSIQSSQWFSWSLITLKVTYLGLLFLIKNI